MFLGISSDPGCPSLAIVNMIWMAQPELLQENLGWGRHERDFGEEDSWTRQAVGAGALLWVVGLEASEGCPLWLSQSLTSCSWSALSVQMVALDWLHLLVGHQG